MTAKKVATKPLALITGASTGIGYELAILFAKDGYDLIIVAENDAVHTAQAALEKIGTKVSALQIDLTTTDSSEKVVSAVRSAGRPLSALVLNAGVATAGAFIGETTIENDLNMIKLNIVSPVSLAKALIPDFVERGEGKVLFTSSIASLGPGPFNAVYHATKAFIQSFTEAVREELKETGVTVTALMPGATETPFFARANMLDTKVGQSKKDDPAQVAEQGYKALMRGDDHVIAGSVMNKVQGLLSKISSDKIKAKNVRTGNEPLHPGSKGSVDAVTMLKNQHREAEDLFNRIEKAEKGEQEAIFQTLATKLLEHMKIEEEVFYPAAEDVNLKQVEHAEEEHEIAKDLIRRLLTGNAKDFLPLVMDLKEKIQHHVKDEEQKLFPECEKTMSKDELVDLADEMRELMVEFALEEKTAAITPANHADKNQNQGVNPS